MSWLSSILHTVEKDVIRPIAPTLITGAAVAGIGALTGGAAFGSQSILTSVLHLGAASGAIPTVGGSVSPVMSFAGQEGMPGVPGVSTQAAPLIDYTGAISGAVGGVEGYLSAASHNVQAQGIRLGIYAVLLLFMLAAFFALLMPDEQQTVEIADSAGKLAALG